MDVHASFKPMDAMAPAGWIKNGGRVRVRHCVNNISHVCWSDVKLTTKFKFKFVTDADMSGRVHVMDQDYWSRWRHQMETFSMLLALCEGIPLVTGEFHSQRPVTQNFDVFFDLCLNTLTVPRLILQLQVSGPELWTTVRINSCHAEFIFRKHTIIPAFSRISQHM